MVNKEIKRLAKLGAIALFAAIICGWIVLSIAGPSVMGGYVAGVFGSLAVAFVLEMREFV